MATQQDGNPIEGIIGKPPIERDMNMGEAGETSGVAGAMLGKTTGGSVMAAREQWQRNKNANRLRSETSESPSALGDWRS